MESELRIEKAKGYKVAGFSGDTEDIEIGISAETFAKYNYKASDFESVSDSGDTYKITNGNFPKMNEENYIEVAELILGKKKSVFDIVKKACETKFCNNARMYLNRDAEAKGVKKALDFEEAKRLRNAGEIDQTEYDELIAEIIAR